MDLLPNDEQQDIIDSVAALLAAEHTVGEVVSAGLWQLAVEQGWPALGISETQGGVGYSIVESALVAAELGKCALLTDLLPSIAAGFVAAHQDPDLLPHIFNGDARFAWAFRDRNHWLILGTPDITHLVAAHDRQFALAAVSGITRSQVPSLDASSTLWTTDASITLHDSDPSLGALMDVLVAAFCSGIAQATTTQSVQYGHDREQFGQAIGTFQAVKHRCADMATRAEAAASSARYASITLRDGHEDAQHWAHHARLVSTSAAIDNAEINVQNHGGIGFTWEHTAHRYVTASRVAERIATPANVLM
jgi:alkylation response protein AidB-like acyl-CoA dehydrogenase